jgi:hypothetical protein
LILLSQYVQQCFSPISRRSARRLVPLELPTGAPGTDYRSGFSVIIKHNGAAAILIGGSANQYWDLAPNTPLPLNDLDPENCRT